MIPDRLIEEGTLTTDGSRTSVEVRIPWYRAIPASCIADVELTVDGTSAPRESITWTMNDRTFGLDALPQETDEWWYVLDSAVVTGDIPVSGDGEHTVEVGLKLYIPYIITDHGVLQIEEHNTKTMKALETKAGSVHV